MIETWKQRCPDISGMDSHNRNYEIQNACYAEINELRAALAEQRKVLEQAQEALQQLFPRNGYEGGVAVWRLGASHAVTEAITAINEVLK